MHQQRGGRGARVRNGDARPDYRFQGQYIADEAVYKFSKSRKDLAGVLRGTICLVGTATDMEEAMKWVTRARPKVDRIACPWLVVRFIDKTPEFLYVPADQVQDVARHTGAIPYDVPGVELGHVGEFCSFDAFLKKYELRDRALARLATIVRGADTSRLDLTAQSAGLYAISAGLSDAFTDDHDQLRHGMVVYDALYAWCKRQA
jgi:hypothetical protein